MPPVADGPPHSRHGLKQHINEYYIKQQAEKIGGPAKVPHAKEAAQHAAQEHAPGKEADAAHSATPSRRAIGCRIGVGPRRSRLIASLGLCR